MRRRRTAAAGVVLAVLIMTVTIANGQNDPEASSGAGRAHPRMPERHPGRSSPSTRTSSGSGAGGSAASMQLRPGSNPAVLPGPVLIADRDNNRILEVSPRGRVLWRFPKPGDLAPGETFKLPDDAFFSPNGRDVIVTQEDDFVISEVSVTHRRIVYRYGHPGVPGATAGYLHNPDDALLTPTGNILSADIKNCRLLVIHPPEHHPLRQLGTTGLCSHELGRSYGSPNGAFPMSNGDTAVTEINGDWLDVLSPGGRPVLDTHPPGFTYPSDTNQIRAGLFLSVDYTNPGAIETFTNDGKLLWRYAPSGPQALNQPSLALPLPNGDILANDDKNDRVIVIDPRKDRIVWQYGHTGVPGSGTGFLSNPDGVDLAPPFSLADRFGTRLHAP